MAVQVCGADTGDTESLNGSLAQAEGHLKQVPADEQTALSEVVADKGYHSNDTMKTLKAAHIRSYVSEPDRGRRNWKKDAPAQAAVYANRRRIRGARGKRLQRRRAEVAERSFAHTYETGGMRRTHVRGHTNIYKRLCIHGGAFNLGLLMRKLIGRGTPRGVSWAVIGFEGHCPSHKRYFQPKARLFAFFELSFSSRFHIGVMLSLITHLPGQGNQPFGTDPGFRNTPNFQRAVRGEPRMRWIKSRVSERNASQMSRERCAGRCRLQAPASAPHRISLRHSARLLRLPSRGE